MLEKIIKRWKILRWIVCGIIAIAAVIGFHPPKYLRQPTVFITTIEEWIINHAAYPGLFIICILILLILLIIPELFSQHLYPFLKRKNSVFNVEGTVNGTALNNPDIYQISIRIKFLSHVENVHISYHYYAKN